MASVGSTQLNRPNVRSSSSPSSDNVRARNVGEVRTWCLPICLVVSI
jgi:hypothetical protein